jgi:hypothetical protein
MPSVVQFDGSGLRATVKKLGDDMATIEHIYRMTLVDRQEVEKMESTGELLDWINEELQKAFNEGFRVGIKFNGKQDHREDGC